MSSACEPPWTGDDFKREWVRSLESHPDLGFYSRKAYCHRVLLLDAIDGAENADDLKAVLRAIVQGYGRSPG